MRLLVLHGYHMNGSIIKKLTLPILKRISHNVNIISPNAPYSVTPHREEITKYFSPPYYSWINNNSTNIDYLKKYNDIDGIICYSQGSSIALSLADYLNPKFIINISGVDKLDYDRILNVPSLHVIGVNDPYYFHSKKLLNKYKSPTIIYHSKGHHFPSDINIYNNINKFITNII